MYGDGILIKSCWISNFDGLFVCLAWIKHERTPSPPKKSKNESNKQHLEAEDNNNSAALSSQDWPPSLKWVDFYFPLFGTSFTFKVWPLIFSSYCFLVLQGLCSACIRTMWNWRAQRFHWKTFEENINQSFQTRFRLGNWLGQGTIAMVS